MTRRWAAAILVSAVVSALASLASSDTAVAASGPGRPITWIAAGDSFSSGEGLPQSLGPCAQASGGDSAAYAQVADNLVRHGGQIQLAAPLGFVACTGARTGEFFAPQDSNPAEWTGGRADLITFTFGGDDIDFPNVIEQCIGLIGPASGNYVQPDPGDHYCPADATMRARIQSELTDKYRTFLTRVANEAVTPGGNIVVLGYPELIEDPDKWTGMPQFFDLCSGITRADALEMRGLAGDLNATLGWDVEQVNAQQPNGVHVTFIDVNSGGSHGIANSDSRLFEPQGGTRHNLCSADSWINGLSSIDYFHGSFHPKQAGLDAEGSLLAQVINTQLSWNFTEPTAPPEAPVASGPLNFAVTGTCTTQSGTLVGTSSGFTPGARYTVTATRPSGQPYDLGSGSSGTVRADGTIVWRWPCAGDPPGTYSTTVVDTATGRTTGPVPFTIGQAAAPNTPTPQPTSSSTAPTPRPSGSNAPQSHTFFDNYGPTTAGVPMCRGNPSRPESMPGGTVTQSFTANATGAVDTATVQIDPDTSVTATATINVNGTDVATTSQPATGDVVFHFSPVAVTAGATVSLRISFSATFGKIITVYEVGNPGGTLSVVNTCPDGAPTFTRTDTGLRAVIAGTA